MAITTQQIHDTADQLSADGIKPTLANVRKALGGGSFTTISEAMKDWHSHNEEEQQLQSIELPSGIDERLQALGSEMWQAAIDIANQRLQAEREALATAQAVSQATADEAQEAVKLLEAEQAELLDQLDNAASESDRLTKQLEDKEKEYQNKYKELLGKLEQSNHFLSSTQHELDLERERKLSLDAKMDEEKQQNKLLLNEYSRLQTELAKSSQQLESKSEKVVELKEEIAKNVDKNQELQDELKKEKIENAKLVGIISELRFALKEARAELKLSDGNLKDAEVTIQLQSSEISKLKKENAPDQKRLTSKKRTQQKSSEAEKE